MKKSQMIAVVKNKLFKKDNQHVLEVELIKLIKGLLHQRKFLLQNKSNQLEEHLKNDSTMAITHQVIFYL